MAAISAAEVRALAMLIDELDYYQLLEIQREVPASAVKRAYYTVTRRLHPDANRNLPPAGTPVTLFGPGDHGEPTAQDWAEACGTISYEIVTRIGGRFERRYEGVET